VTADELHPTSEQTSLGTVTVTWGFNRWALLDLAGRSLQRQVRSERDLVQLLASAGLPSVEAKAHGTSLWHARPKDAGIEAARPRQALWRATGLPAWAIALILVALIALFVLFRVAHLLG
jgi:hypothetical protein